MKPKPSRNRWNIFWPSRSRIFLACLKKILVEKEIDLILIGSRATWTAATARRR